jgi:hypothetical protein
LGVDEFHETWLAGDWDDDYQYKVRPEIAAGFGWWCFLHNIDQAATLFALSKMRWEDGFQAGQLLTGFASA